MLINQVFINSSIHSHITHNTRARAHARINFKFFVYLSFKKNMAFSTLRILLIWIVRNPTLFIDLKDGLAEIT